MGDTQIIRFANTWVTCKLRYTGGEIWRPKAVARKGGNPDLEKHQFQQRYNWDEPCTEKIYFRVPPSMKAALPDGWQEACRQTIAALIDQQKTEKLHG